MFDLLEKYIMGPMTKLSQFRMIRAITFAGMTSISFTIVGSMFLILNVLPQAFPFLAGIWSVSFDKITNIYMLANSATIGCIAVYFLIATAFEYARILSEEDEIDIKPINAVLMAVMALFICIPQIGIVDGVISLLNDPEAGLFNGWTMGSGPARFGATGIFCAFIIAWFSVRIYALCVQKNIVIKLPDVVPDGVARSFTALIHGATIVTSPLTAIALSNLVVNAEGGTAIWAGEFNNAFVTVGGSGATLGLTILMLTLAKSEQLKAIGKAEIVPALFNINEPLIFGLPIVYNPALAIPFMLAPMAAAAISYLAISMHIIPAVMVLSLIHI